MRLVLVCFLLAATLTTTGAARGEPAVSPSARVEKALRIAAATWRVPYSELRSVAWCESRFNPHARNENSDAAGLLQFLASTWRGTPYRAFSRYDPEANALAAAWVVHQDGGWGEWTCRP